jgi:hypothetical protein
VSTDDSPTEPSPGPPAADHTTSTEYDIRVQGRLGTRWAAWFDGMALTDSDDGTTVICGPVVDQAALHGQLQKLRDLGVTLLSVAQHASGTAIERPDLPHGQHGHNPPGATP